MKWIYVVTWAVLQVTGPSNKKMLAEKKMTRQFSTGDSARAFIKVGTMASRLLTFKIDSTRIK